MHRMKEENNRTAQLPFLLIAGFYGALMTVIVVLCVFFSGIDYAWKTVDRLGIPNVLLLLMGICLLLLLYRIFLELDRPKFQEHRKMLNISLAAVSLIFLFLQIYMVRQYYFYTGWDAGTVLSAAVEAAAGRSLNGYQHYLSAYPNNLMIIRIYALVVKAAVRMGLEAYYAVLVFQCVLCWATGLLVYHVALRLRKRYACGCFAYAVYLLLVGLSPWAAIPYTDAVALIFPMTVLALYVQKWEKPAFLALKWFLIAGVSWMGFKIKPQVLILTIAIVIVQFALFLWEKKSSRRVMGTGMTAFAAGIFCAVLLSRALVGTLDVEIDPEQSFGLPHYFMMGLNTEFMGVYAHPDVQYSESFPTVEERTKMDFKLAGERLREMGPGGLMRQLHRKVLTNYNDGTFCWGGEGAFYDEVLAEKDGWLSPFLRNLYYNGEQEGRYYRYWSCFAQLLWLAILTVSILAVWKLKDPATAVMLLAIVGVSLFQIIFEARGRYLYHYAPVYVLLAAVGVDRLRLLFMPAFEQ